MINNSLRYAAQALKREVLGFRLEYPVESLKEAGPKDSLHYYVWSESLFLEDLVFDESGVPRKRYRAQGLQYNPLFIAWWGLFNLERYLRSSDQDCLRNFFIQIDWLKAHAVHRTDEAVVWPCYFDWQEGLAALKSPWISAMYQSVVISALVRAYRITKDKELLFLCMKGTQVFERSIEQGGVRTTENGHVLYEEYPVHPLPRVLDGFLFSLLGLYDLAVETDDTKLWDTFYSGVDGLKHKLDFWNYRGKWSWYGSHGYLCPPHYHSLNALLLSVLGRLTNDGILLECSAVWDAGHRPLLDKIEIFLVFLISKNWARFRLPRN